VKSFVLFVTHYPLLAELEPKYPQIIANFHMAYVEVEESS
jgi:DNA mismatch repair ATPase MutS